MHVNNLHNCHAVGDTTPHVSNIIYACGVKTYETKYTMSFILNIYIYKTKSNTCFCWHLLISVNVILLCWVHSLNSASSTNNTIIHNNKIQIHMYTLYLWKKNFSFSEKQLFMVFSIAHSLLLLLLWRLIHKVHWLDESTSYRSVHSLFLLLLLRLIHKVCGLDDFVTYFESVLMTIIAYKWISNICP